MELRTADAANSATASAPGERVPGGGINQAGEIRSARVESIRALAALGVLCSHALVDGFRNDPIIFQGWHRFVQAGGFGVFVFFSLSGYLLVRPFVRAGWGEGRDLSLRQYAINRAVRILPLYYTVYLVYVLVRQHGGTFHVWWRFLLVFPNYDTQTLRLVDGGMWSIVVEVEFYLLLPLLAWGLAKLCGRSLIPESQKGHVYYRCQNKRCPTKSIRQEPIEQGVLEKLLGIDLSAEQHEYLKQKFDEFQQNRGQKSRQAIEAEEIQLSQIKDRLNRLTDAYLDSAIDHETFEQRKTALLMGRRGIEDRIQDLKNGSPDLPKKLNRLLELLKNPYLQYVSGSPDERKELIQNVCSNRTLAEKTLEISYALPFDQVALCFKNTSGAPSRHNARMWDRLAESLFNFAKKQAEDQGEQS